ncbi:MAG: alpha/beta fold hydrolase, partial [Betaproteobacteria bacterium]|nr:alpha/beta fold hydrolase [Betaproteobacteria bacterium]
MTRPTIALLHGWGLDSRVWDELAAALDADFDLRRLDLPGYHGTPELADNSVAATVDWLLGQLPEGCTLVGWSLGALLAQHMASQAPEKIARLVLVAGTPCFTRGTDWPAGQPPELLATFSAAVQQQPDSVLSRFAALINQGDAQARAITRRLAPLTRAPLPAPATLARGLEWLRDLDLRQLAPRLAQPCLLLHGDQDPLMPLAAAQWLAAQLPQASLEVFPGSAHSPFLADPERFARSLAAFAGGSL